MTKSKTSAAKDISYRLVSIKEVELNPFATFEKKGRYHKVLVRLVVGEKIIGSRLMDMKAYNNYKQGKRIVMSF